MSLLKPTLDDKPTTHLIFMVTITGHVTGFIKLNVSGFVYEFIPDTLALTVFIPRSLHLVGRCGA